MTIKQRLAEGESIFGCFNSVPHAMIVELLGMTGLDFVCIDGEHSQIDRAGLESLLRAADAGNIPAMIRIPQNDPVWIASALDAGAQALLIPRVSTVEEARQAVRAARFAPVGQRGLGPGRASGYGYGIEGFVERSEERLLLAIQLETSEALRNAQELAAVDGIDMIFVGPHDLSLSLQAEGDGVALHDAIAQIGSAARKAGKALGLFCLRAADTRQWTEHGYRLFVVGSDSLFLGEGAMQMIGQARE